uniref:Protein transport protein sec16 n=1 Tax=Amblyomma aureolatum TaxID=187763 RepID=A0A1E1X407_9ACAR
MLQRRYPTGKAAEAAQPPAATLPQPIGEAMPQWDGGTFQPTQYPAAALLDPQQQQQEGWSSAATSVGSTAGPAVHYGDLAQGDTCWNWSAHQEPGAGGDEVVSAAPPMQSWNNWGAAAQEAWTGGAQPPDPAGGVGGVNDGTYPPPQLYPGATQFAPHEGPQEGWVAPHWAGETNQWPSSPEHQQQYVMAQWQWQGGVPAEGWSSAADGQWQGSQLDLAAAGHYESASLVGYAPPDGPAASSSSGPAAMDGQGGSEGSTVEECSQQQHLEATSGDDGTVSMFFQDGGAAAPEEERTPVVEESREGGPTTTQEVVEDDQQQTAAGIAEDGGAAKSGKHETVSQVVPAASSDESVNQQVPEPLMRPEPQEVLPLHGEASAPGGEDALLALPSGSEGRGQCPAPSKKAVIRARQGGAFKPLALVRQGSSTETALLQQNALHLPPENLELLPPDEIGRHHASLRHRQGLASPAAMGSIGAGLTLLDAPEMQPCVTLAPAAPPIPHDRPASRASSLTGAQTSEAVEASSAPETTVARMVAPPLMRQSPLGREEGTGRSTAAPPPLRVATVLAPSPLLADTTLPERTEPSGSTDGDHPQPVVTAARAGEDKEVARPKATSTPAGHSLTHHEPPNVSAMLAHPKHDSREPGDKVRQEEPRKGMQDERDSRDFSEARGRGSDDDSLDWKGSRDERDSRQGGRGELRDDQDPKRDRYYDRSDDRRDASKEDREEYRKAGRRIGTTEDRKRRDDYYDGRRGDQHEDRREDFREDLRDDYRKSQRRVDRYHDRRDQWKGQESDEEWKERRSDRRSDRHSIRHDYRYDDRYSDRHSDRGRPSSQTSQDAYLDEYDRRGGDRRIRDSHNRPSSRHSESDSSSPESRRGYGTGKHRKYRDVDRAPGAYYDHQKGYGTTGGYDYNAYRRDYYNYYHYGYAPRSGYGYGYYDELYRTNPAYKQQVDAYYARLGYNPAQLMERLSVHSGRSSANGDSRRDESFASNTEDDCDPSILDNECARLDHVPQPEEVNKFSRPHPLARFCGASGLLKLVPTLSGGNLPPPIEIHSLKHLFQKDPQFHELQQFPGPLVRSQTHKNDVIQFCTQKIQSFAEDPNLPDRSSHILLWELLVLMLRQNGFVSGSDIAELLLRGHHILEPVASASVLARPGGEGGEVTSPEVADDGSSPSPDEGIVVSDRTQLGATGSSQTLAKFREFLLFGHKKDALEWAVKCGLWGHALSLASKMDARTYASIVTRFTNALAINDPLQTLYQHLSGRQPAAVTCIADDKWGDWRPHLAMILSNPSSRPEVDARSITTLGDVLASRGCLSAAHFCYLMAQVEFGSYSCKSSKLVLLGSSHQTLPFEEFASNEAVQCTEIYEYSQSLANAGYMLPHLQVYKFLHATRLAEYGFAQEALHYCEVLAEAMARQCGSTQLAAQTYELASRLKYHDPHFSQGPGELEELGEPLWLAAFAQLVTQLLQLDTPPQVGVLYGQGGSCGGNEGQSVTEVSGMESYHDQPGFTSSTGFSMHDSGMSILDPTVCGDSAQASAEQWTPLAHATHDISRHLPTSVPSFAAETSSVESGWNSVPTAAQPSSEYSFVSTGPPPPVEPAAIVNGGQADGSAPSSPPISSQASTFDYYKASTYSHVQHPPHRRTSRERLSSVSSSTDTRDQRDSVDSAALASGRSRLPSGPLSSLATDRSASESEQTKPAATNKGKTQVAGKSWLGGIFGKLLPKGPNQMILPDDKDPDIVWDEQKQCWVDKNAAPGDADIRSVAPPTDSSFGGKPSPLSGKPGENRFQMAKQRSLRKHYVDVLNPGSNKASGASPAVPPVPAMQTPPQFLVAQAVGDQRDYDFVSPAPMPDQSAPAPPPPPETSVGYQQQQQQQQQQPAGKVVATPMMFDPADFSSRAVDSSHKMASGNLARRRAYPT